MEISRIAPACALALVFAPRAVAEPLSCSAQPTHLGNARAEGFAELAGDILITCVGGAPTPAGSPIPQITVTLRSPVADITSRVLATSGGTSWSEALLLLDDPLPAAWYLCTDPSGTCPGYGNGTGRSYYGGGAQSPAAPNNRNVFQAKQSGGTLTWTFPFDPSASLSRVIRIVNIRLNANQAGLPPGGPPGLTQVPVVVSAPPILSDTSLPVALIPERSGFPRSASLIWQPSGRSTIQPLTSVVAREANASEWKRRSAADPGLSGTGVPPPVSSALVGVIYPAESGLYNPALPAIQGRGDLALAGLADHGTRIMARFAGVPPGARIFVPSRITIETALDPVAASGYAVLTATDSRGAGAFSAIAGDSAGLAPVAIVNGSGMSVWEIATAIGFEYERLSIDVFGSYPAGNFPPGSVRLDLAPTVVAGSASIPRFAVQGGTSANCSYQVTPITTDLPLEGGSFEFSVATDVGCEWTSQGSTAWFSLPGPVQGSGRVLARAPFNAGPPRVAAVTVAGQTFQVRQSGGGFAYPSPIVTAPLSGQTIPVSGVSFSWNPVTGATGYDIRIVDGSPAARTIYQGSLAGSATGTLIDIPYPDLSYRLPAVVPYSYVFFVRACNGGFADANCGPFGAALFSRQPPAPPPPTRITSPVTSGQILYDSTVQFAWQPVDGADSYRVIVKDANGREDDTILQQTVRAPNTSLTHTLGAGYHTVTVLSCSAICDGANVRNNQNLSGFQLVLPTVVTGIPAITQAAVSGSQLNAAWTPVPGADAYRVQVVQPNAGPGGGALTVASRQTTLTNATLTLPAGSAAVFVQACNGNGCGAFSPPTNINVTGPNPATPVIGTPLTGISTAGPGVLFSWSRVPGDTGSNTTYRLYVADLSRNSAQAADIHTTSNFAGVQLAPEGRRYDAVVVANPGPGQVAGPASGFQVLGGRPRSPTLTTPGHRSRVRRATRRSAGHRCPQAASSRFTNTMSRCEGSRRR